ncbi:hypothetical protein BDV19DRAFT_380292 [Aspergillus venezuelensis]
MPQVVVVGAGFYGLIAAKTYLQVTGAYKNTTTETTPPDNGPNTKSKGNDPVDDVLIIDSASDIGGTWASERLYPNLLSQNSYGHYEFSDLSLREAVPDDEYDCGEREDEKIFIPGWKINRYLHVWSEKWDLSRRIRLNWEVTRISRLPSKEWKLEILKTRSSTLRTVTCDKLILATGLTSDPNFPKIPRAGDHPIPEIHAKDLGQYCRDTLGYLPIPQKKRVQEKKEQLHPPKSVAVYGGAKSAFDFIHLFGSLHCNSESFNVGVRPKDPIQVHWIIREDGHGPAWMTRPTAQLGRKMVPSDQAVCTRVVGLMSICVNEIPKQISWPSIYSIPHLKGSWRRRVLHGNPLGRALIRHLWKGVDADIHDFAQYDSQPKMGKLRPSKSVIECTSPGGIANHSDLWETIRSPNVHIHRSSIAHISSESENARLKLANGTRIEVDLVLHATGWKSSCPIPFEPPELFDQLGLPFSDSKAGYAWEAREQEAESRLRSNFDQNLFKHATEPAPSAYRLFRRLASPSLVAEGDRSFAVMGAVYIGAVGVVAEVQALWMAAFITGAFDETQDSPLAEMENVYESVAEDVMWSRLTGVGLNVDTLPYNDQLMQDLGLNPYRAGGWWWKELMAVYGPRSYAGIVEEWMEKRGGEIRGA